MKSPDLFYQNYSVLGGTVFGEAYNRVAISEKDGGVIIEFEPQNLNDDSIFGVFMNIDEAKEFYSSLKESIDRASYKNQNRIVHPRRSK